MARIKEEEMGKEEIDEEWKMKNDHKRNKKEVNPIMKKIQNEKKYNETSTWIDKIRKKKRKNNEIIRAFHNT